MANLGNFELRYRVEGKMLVNPDLKGKRIVIIGRLQKGNKTQYVDVDTGEPIVENVKKEISAGKMFVEKIGAEKNVKSSFTSTPVSSDHCVSTVSVRRKDENETLELKPIPICFETSNDNNEAKNVGEVNSKESVINEEQAKLCENTSVCDDPKHKFDSSENDENNEVEPNLDFAEVNTKECLTKGQNSEVFENVTVCNETKKSMDSTRNDEHNVVYANFEETKPDSDLEFKSLNESIKRNNSEENVDELEENNSKEPEYKKIKVENTSNIVKDSEQCTRNEIVPNEISPIDDILNFSADESLLNSIDLDSFVDIQDDTSLTSIYSTVKTITKKKIVYKMLLTLDKKIISVKMNPIMPEINPAFSGWVEIWAVVNNENTITAIKIIQFPPDNPLYQMDLEFISQLATKSWAEMSFKYLSKFLKSKNC